MHARRRHLPVVILLVAWMTLPAGEVAADDAVPRSLLRTYCVRCHNADKRKGDVDLSSLGARPDSLAGRKVWRKILEQLRTEEMPPEDPQPTEDERRELDRWAEHGLAIDASSKPHPGRVTIPRLTRDEYNNTMRDLLGIDLQPGNALSADGEGKSGFNTDRDALFLTPALLEKYLAAAGAALDACIALELEPASYHYESEDLLMTETREVPRAFGDGSKGYVLNRGQMTLYTSVRFPYDGYYTFRIRALSSGRPSGARLRIDGETKGDVIALSSTPEILTLTCYVKQGSRQMTWNIQAPDAPAPRVQAARPQGVQTKGAQTKAARVQAKQQVPKKTGLPENAASLVSTRAEENRPEYPLKGDEPAEIRVLARRIDVAGLAVQRPYEWLRVLGTEGDRSEIGRFKSYIVQRGALLEAAKTALTEALGLTRAELDRLYEEHNRARLEDNRKLLEAVAHVPAPVLPPVTIAPGLQNRALLQGPGSIALDWVEIRGPVHPDGPGKRSRIFNGEVGGISKRESARKILAAFLPRAFRRPVSEDEVEHYLPLFDRADCRGDSFEASVKLSLLAVLISPHFLYRNEFGPVDGDYRLDDYQLASRLSYFLWMSMPDDALFALAAEGRLHEPDVLSAQVDRMLADAKSRAFTSAFLGQWLGFESLGRAVVPDQEKFPQFTPELCEAMKQEAILGFESLLRDRGSLLALIDARETWLNEPLARHYGINGVSGDAMRRVRLDDPNRGGLLGMAGVLTVTSSPTRTNPVIRGKWVLQTLLGEAIPEPPADAGTLDPEAGEARGKTLREELLQHRRNVSCAACHNKIDPIGFGLENFDAIGRYRTNEAGQPIDNQGELPGGVVFRGPAELKQVLMDRRQTEFARNVAERMLSFALGRQLELFDEPALAKITAAVEADGLRAATLVKQIVMCYPFQYQNHRDTLE